MMGTFFSLCGSVDRKEVKQTLEENAKVKIPLDPKLWG